MNATTAFFITICVQLTLGLGQVIVAIIFVYRWQKNSWRFTNLMNIREPLARAYCSLSAILDNRKRLAAETDDNLKAHDRQRIHDVIVRSQNEILEFSIEHFKAKFWMRGVENVALDNLFDKLHEVWNIMRSDGPDAEASLISLRQEILRFDSLCGLENYNGGMWSHVALHT